MNGFQNPLSVPTPHIPAQAAAPVGVTSIVAEEPTDDWRDVQPGKHLEFAGIFDQGYVHYRVKFNLSANEVENPLAPCVRSKGWRLPDSANQWNPNALLKGWIFRSRQAAEGNNTADILFENLGCPNFGPVIEQRQGITHISLVPRAAHAHAVEGWRMKVVTGNAADLAEVRANFDDHDWPTVGLTEPSGNTPAGMRAVYSRKTLPISKQWLAAEIRLTFGTIDDRGTLYVNGQKAGRRGRLVASLDV